MKILSIKKSSGKTRIVVCPSKEQKEELRNMLTGINLKTESICAPNVHGFMRGKSPVTHAIPHIGKKYTLSMDLSDFFDHVKTPMVRDFLSTGELRKVIVDPGDNNPRACQGLPTSPAVANLAFAKVDQIILDLIKKSGKEIVYTRYADDLNFSFNEKEIREFLLKNIPEIVTNFGFKLNESKTHFCLGKRRVICGVSVGEKDIRPSRRTKRKLRAAKHQSQFSERAKNSARGLEEWCELKRPTKGGLYYY